MTWAFVLRAWGVRAESIPPGSRVRQNRPEGPGTIKLNKRANFLLLILLRYFPFFSGLVAIMVTQVNLPRCYVHDYPTRAEAFDKIFEVRLHLRLRYYRCRISGQTLLFVVVDRANAGCVSVRCGVSQNRNYVFGCQPVINIVEPEDAHVHLRNCVGRRL